MQSKPLDDIDVDVSELVDLALSDSKAEPKASDFDVRYREVRTFVRSRDIKVSKQAVPVQYIFSAYLKFSKDPLKLIGFARYFSKFFKGKRLGVGVTVYNINPESVGLHDTYSVYKDPHYFKSYSREPKMQYLGVYYNRNNRIVVRVITPQGAYKVIRGAYKTLKAAARAYDKYVIEMYGKDAVVNFPHMWKGQLHGTEKAQQDQD